MEQEKSMDAVSLVRPLKKETRFCGDCQSGKWGCVLKEPCEECYSVKDVNGKRIKPHFKQLINKSVESTGMKEYKLYGKG
jgi:cytochrome c2